MSQKEISLATSAKRSPGPWWQRLLRQTKSVTDTTELVFPDGFMELLERLRIVALKASGGGLKEGHRLGAYRGGQLEFHDHRSYTPGDDLRYLDWNLYARLGKPFIKEFAREEAGQMYLLLDASASMRLGSPTKWITARRIAALFTHVGLSARDSVQLFAFHGRHSQAIPDGFVFFPRPGPRVQTRNYLDWLNALSCAPAADELLAENEIRSAELPELTAAIRRFLSRQPPRGRVFVISDFWYETTDLTQTVQLLAGAGFELAALHLLAREELATPESGALRVYGLEDPDDIELHLTPQTTLYYQEELENHRLQVERLFRKRAGQYLFETADVSLEKVLIQALRQRNWMR